ncbi:MAG: hypothetical protein K6T81_01050 [Alicyclobacillus macrosporangiidus]|uniref:hypothetical protein n=1 Tax=Alicyclobacillus macrosporangiidus TaxID=392015 RepID=UPI0026EE2686|nr:hypothetical protein [Alicyclobacillus macrosporangiidus]MCL6597307.1 hypothetical protein [Alicyclobacillus macrosporangiidus]
MLDAHTWKRWVLALAACFGVSACGAPDLASMRPMHEKPAAEVVVVGNPPHWSDQDLNPVLTSPGLVTQVARVSSGSLRHTLDQVLNQARVGLVVVVDPDGPSQEAWSAANGHSNVRFEWVGGVPQADQGDHVAQVVVDLRDAAYSLGWTAGQLAASQPVATVGWVADGSAAVGKEVITAALAGLYGANTTVQLKPVTAITAMDPTAGPAPLPKVIVTPRHLTPAEWSTFRAQGILVLSLCPQPGLSGLAGVPAAPGAASVAGDLSAYASGHWRGGVRSVRQSPFTKLDPNLVPAGVQASVSSVELSMEAGSLNPSAAWGQLPVQLRAQWAAVVGSGIA